MKSVVRPAKAGLYVRLCLLFWVLIGPMVVVPSAQAPASQITITLVRWPFT
jgi:hypothetical protein